MKITLFESDDLFLAVPEEEWDELLVDSSADRVFLTHVWQSEWWQAYHPGQVWTLVLRDDTSNRLLGLVPWFLEIDPDGMRIIRAIGCTDVTDYLEIVARRGYEDAVFEAVADYIAAHTSSYERICLCNLPQESPTLVLLARLLEERCLVVTTGLEDVCPVIELPDEWEAYVASLDKKNRHELRRKLRRASGSADKVDWYIVGNEQNIDEEMARFLRLMAASSEDKTRFLADPANRTFFEHVVPVIAKRGWLQLAFLTVNGEAAAAYLNFEYSNRVLVYNSGHDPVSYSHLSPGIVLLAKLIERAINQKRELFDFLRGNESYKYDMGGKDTGVYQMVIRAADEP